MTHNDLIIRAVQWLRSQGYHACLAEPTLTHELPDAIGWNSHGGSAVIECKVSRSDFRADMKKPCHRRPSEFTLGNYRWYLTPRNLIRADEVPAGHGLLEITEKKVFVTVKAPRRQAHAATLERSMLAEALGRVQRGHFGEAFACPEAYMDARIWVRGQAPDVETPEDIILEEEVALPDDFPVKSEKYRKLSCVDRTRALSGRVLDLLHQRAQLSGATTSVTEVLEALAHIRRAEEILFAATRRDKVSSSPENKYA